MYNFKDQNKYSAHTQELMSSDISVDIANCDIWHLTVSYYRPLKIMSHTTLFIPIDIFFQR